MDSLETDDLLTIVNRSTEHRISKKLVRKIPYFEKILSHDSLESEENKIELDFDDKAFKIILDWIEMGHMLIKKDNVMALCNMAGYFGMNDDLIKDCVKYYRKTFTIGCLHTITPQVILTSKLIDSRVFNAFICRLFMQIVDLPSWLDFSFETIDYICKLDLMIYSEFQVFEAIMVWVAEIPWNLKSRKSHLKSLLNSVRWCHMESKHLTKVKRNELIKSEGFVPPFCSRRRVNCVCSSNRTIKGYFIIIEELEGTDLRIKVLDSNFLPLINQVIQLHSSMPMFALHDEHVSDISFDSGRKMIRVDWKQNKYRLLDYKAYVFHYFEIDRCSMMRYTRAKYQGTQSHSSFSTIYGSSLLEANGKFVLLHIYDGCVAYCSEPGAGNIESKLFDYEHSFISTILDKNIYIITKNFDFMTFNIDQEKKFGFIELTKLAQLVHKEQLKLDDTFLTSSQVENAIFLVDKSTRNVFRYDIVSEEWDLIGLLINYDYNKTDGQKEPIKLVTFTSALLSIDTIRPCLKRKLDSMN